MKMYKILKLSLQAVFAFSVLVACVKDNDYSTPEVGCVEPLITATNSIDQIKEMYTFGGATIIEKDVVISGYVVSNDRAGNIYKSISIQDKPVNPTSAIKIAIDETDLYTKYNLGRKIYIKLKGLAVGYSFGSIQIGKAKDGELGRIPSSILNDFVVRSCEVTEIIPKIISIDEIDKSMLEMLVEIENVQFKENELGQSFANIDNTETVNRTLENFTTDCELKNVVMLRNSGFAEFKNQLLPEGKGTIIGVLGNYYEDFQLYIRDVNDVQFTETRCDYANAFQPNVTLSEVNQLFTGDRIEFGVKNNYVVEGFVISSDEKGSFQNRLVVQDAIENPSAGIQLLIDQELIFEQFNVGDKVLIKLDKLYAVNQDGFLTIGFPKGTGVTEIDIEYVNDYVYNTKEHFTIIPKEILLSETSDVENKNILVKVSDVQLMKSELGKAFAYFSGDDNGFRTLETCNESTKLSVFTNGKAEFANEMFPEGHGSITGVLSNTIEIRATKDLEFNSIFEVCPIIIPKIMITEIADPKNSVSSRFVELYNAGETEVNLTGWKLNKYLNGSLKVSGSALELNGIIIPVGGFVIIANTGFEEVFSIIPTIESTYISGNGDDVYELMDTAGNRVDIYGVIGEDGSGTNWEYLDGQAKRNLEVKNPNKKFIISEWEVSSNVNNIFINHPNTQKIAPNDFLPNYR
ncbi:DUF5689 domain-containing protein [Lutibacter citreus]|uniref:DUF5689 domain-containing protein n=1 Tax=Lutibacter citreus TaxID=2138210 RepID=UPI000DBE2569|nr:DUF5689 domain-containing protein [Lutibacter citreus]